ncbi:MAG: hypothetical protein HKN49_14120 [Gammaproteobacteria bacterium]|nr:hypothetical protein [Gammaproteobacteria bacterium]
MSNNTIAIDSEALSHPEAEHARRQLPDRRTQQFNTFNARHIGIRPRRQQVRRDGDVAGGYVDWYDARLLLSALGITVCCCLDAFFTLTLLSMGATELNLLMAVLIETDIRKFVMFKVGLTCLSVVLLVIHYNFRVVRGIRVEHLLHAAFLAYATLVGYELVLLANPPL